MVETSDLSYTYESGKILSFPDIDMGRGEHMLIVGPSGVGKTTLLYLMSGLVPPLTGTVAIDGTILQTLSSKERDGFRGEHIGIIFQQYHFMNSLNVADNLLLRQVYPHKNDDQKRKNELSERLGLLEHFDKKVTTLSQGQQQRLAIALGLIHRPKIVFADEPTSNLDDDNCEKVIDLLKEEARICKSSLVIITHDQRVKSHFDKHVLL